MGNVARFDVLLLVWTKTDALFWISVDVNILEEWWQSVQCFIQHIWTDSSVVCVCNLSYRSVPPVCPSYLSHLCSPSQNPSRHLLHCISLIRSDIQMCIIELHLLTTLLPISDSVGVHLQPFLSCAWIRLLWGFILVKRERGLYYWYRRFTFVL